MQVRFFSLASGSSGNCYFIGTSEYGMLIDAGIGIRTIKKNLRDYNIDLSQIMAVLVTHDHADHIKMVGCLGEKYNIPIYATEEVHLGIARSRYVEEVIATSKRIVTKEETFAIRDFEITAFEVPHDGSDNVGYHITFGNHKFTLATDVGHITPDIERYMRTSNHLVLEANYDTEMLHNGNYPAFLKSRIESPTGHLSNKEAADFLCSIFDVCHRNIWLCHLSRDNNHPELAYKTIELTLRNFGIIAGKDVNLTALKRTTPSEIYYFDDEDSGK